MKRTLFLFAAMIIIPLSAWAAPAWWKVNDQNNTLWFSLDGNEWNQAWETSWTDEKGVWYKTDKNNQVWWSTDGENWKAVTEQSNDNDDWMKVANNAFEASDGKWYKYDSNLQLWWTTDGKNWARVPVQAFPSVDGKWLKFDGNGNLWWSDSEGRRWEKAPNNTFEGANGTWYQYDADWNLWKKETNGSMMKSSVSKQNNMSAKMSGGWMSAPDNIWKDKHGHWYKVDGEGNLWISTDGDTWKPRKSQMWFGPNNELYRISRDGMVRVRMRGQFAMASDNAFEGPDGVWYKIDANWNVWWKQ